MKRNATKLSMEYKIEEAKVEDINDIYELIYKRCLWFAEKGIKGWNVQFHPNKYDKDYFCEQMKINKLFVAKHHNKACGAMLLKNKDNDFWSDDVPSYYLHHLTTDINEKGVGKRLIGYAVKQCAKDNKMCLRLDCYKDSTFLNQYYKSMGFNHVGGGSLGNYNYNLWEMKVVNENIIDK